MTHISERDKILVKSSCPSMHLSTTYIFQKLFGVSELNSIQMFTTTGKCGLTIDMECQNYGSLSIKNRHILHWLIHRHDFACFI